MDRFIAVVIIVCLSIMMVPYGSLCVISSGALRSAYQMLFAWETRSWNILEGDHYIIKYQNGDQENARLTLQEAERLYEPLGEYFGCFPEKRVPVAIYRNKSALNRVFGWDSDINAMGVYWGGVIRLLSPDDWLDEFSRAAREDVYRRHGPIAHEYIHLLVDYKTRGNYPRWLTEGLAQYGEKYCTGMATVTASAEERPALSISLEDLDKKFDDPEWQDYCYTVSEEMVEFMISNYGADSIPLLLEELGRGKGVDSAFHKVLGVNLRDFTNEYHSENIKTEKCQKIS
ncbi:MAG TPA: hypothetical protein DDW83_03580 [Peptococcaceae bacterium]|nr:hypothetical protein [Peptococcaceae bacterium]